MPKLETLSWRTKKSTENANKREKKVNLGEVVDESEKLGSYLINC